MTGSTRSSVALDLLAGTKVVELSTRVSGAYCGHLLQLLGASVARFDSAIEADIGNAHAEGLALSLHRGKTTVALAALGQALDAADILVIDVDPREDVAPEVADAARTALSHGVTRVLDLSDHVPVTADRHVRQSPLTASAQAGMAWAIGHPDKEPLGLPHDLPDYLAGSEGAAAACAMLLEDVTAENRYSVNPTSTVANYVGQICSNFVPYGRPWHRSGPSASMSGGSYPAAMFRCSDGHVSIMCRTNREWLALLTAMGDPAWADEPELRDARVVARHHADTADSHVKPWVQSHTRAEILELGNEFGFPIAPVLRPREALSSSDVVAPNCLRPGSTDGSLEFTIPWTVGPATPALAGQREPWQPRGGANLPLAGLRVLDLSWVWAGPMVTGILRDLGAEVIKVESRTRPDPSRVRDGALVDGRPASGPALETSAYFNQLNSGKQSIVIDIAAPDGRALVLDLAAQVDVVVENMRPGALQRRGLDYDALKAVNGSLVMLSMSIFGHDSPLSRVGGYAPVMSGYSGLDSLVGYEHDDVIGLFNPALGDPIGASHAVTALLAALVRRAQSGVGCWIDVSQVAALLSILRRSALEPESEAPPGNTHATWSPHGVFRCAGADAWIAVSARTPAALSAIDARIGPATDRETAEERISRWAATRDVATAVTDLTRAGVAAAPVSSFEELRNSRWHETRGLVTTARQHFLPDQAVFHTPWMRNGLPLGRVGPGPTLGEHTAEVLQSVLNLEHTRITDLSERGVVEIGHAPISMSV